jgi:hypothetical protein
MLLTKAITKQLPPLYTAEHAADPRVVCKFFTPTSSWTWYAIEYDGDDIFFGYADNGQGGGELGYFSLAELQAIRGPFGLGVERDRYFTPCPLSEAKRR